MTTCRYPGCGSVGEPCGRDFPWTNFTPDLAHQLRSRCGACGHFAQCHRQPTPTHFREDWDE